MNIEELNKKVKKIRLLTDAKLKNLRDHSKLLESAFEELRVVQNEELDLIYEKIKELDDRMTRNGLKD